MRVVLFLDNVCPKPYDHTTLGASGFGGTEQTVTRVAEGLANTGWFKVIVEQHNRQEAAKSKVDYLPDGSTTQADYVVCLRNPESLLKARSRFKNAKIYLWSHDLAGQALGQRLQCFLDSGCTSNIVVSHYHKLQTIEALKPFGYKGGFTNKVVYNPIRDGLAVDDTQYDKNQLCFISSPHKGLQYALEVFSYLRRLNPDFKLVVTNPGYFDGLETAQEGVLFTGSVSHDQVISILRSSLCMFYPNLVFPETFGLVMAESNAVGTPVLTHAFGAAPEVCDVPSETMDCRDKEPVIRRVMEWYEGARPTVRMKPQFKLANVLRSWRELFNGY